MELPDCIGCRCLCRGLPVTATISDPFTRPQIDWRPRLVRLCRDHGNSRNVGSRQSRSYKGALL